VIGELIEKIKDAEARAAKIIADAQTLAEKIESDTQKELEKIKDTSTDEIARKSRSEYHAEHTPVIPEKLTVGQNRITAAKKYITDEFHRRYS
jgi:vacuolar-type H+-ATPase subunit E/Vma4